MANEVRIEARPWEPQDLIDDLQLMIDEEPGSYLNDNRTMLCMARDYLKKFFAEESLRPKGRWIERKSIHAEGGISAECSVCNKSVQYLGNPLNYCPNCGKKMEG